MTVGMDARDAHRRTVLVLSVVVALVAVPASARRVLVTGKQIRNESLTSRDVRGLQLKDFTPHARAKLLRLGPAGPPGQAGPAGRAGPAGETGPPGPGGP
jgi:hypothetical protein